MTRVPKVRILRTILNGVKRLADDNSWPTRRQFSLMGRHRAVTAVIMQTLYPNGLYGDLNLGGPEAPPVWNRGALGGPEL